MYNTVPVRSLHALITGLNVINNIGLLKIVVPFPHREEDKTNCGKVLIYCLFSVI